MLDYRFERISRTPQSEQYLIETAQHSIGRVDLHYTNSKAYGTLIVHASVPEEEIEDLISAVDDRLVSSADEYREDFIVTVWRGEEFGTFSEDPEGFEEPGASATPDAVDAVDARDELEEVEAADGRKPDGPR